MPLPAGARDDVIGYPVQPAKVQRPPLRDETLARDRLLDWLNVKIHHRVVVITAEAGYGKTTLLADFSRRTRHRTLWYRLDEEDRSWVAFLSYLVAAGREHDPNFAPNTHSLLRETGATGPSPDSVIETFVREFQTLGELGAVLILDDYHVVDDAPDVRQIMGQLLARAPERVTFVVSTRRRPSIRVARLRGRGEVAELTTDDLRFSESETEQLFRDTYRRPLEPDVLDDLSRRTEGWAASLQLVQAALRDRTASQIRTFVRNLSGAEGDLYDYFAEEVVGDLDERLQDFLMRTSILDSVDPDLARVVTNANADEVRGHIDLAETLGLLSRRSEGSKQVKRYHPLVRQFLDARLHRAIGDDRVRSLHNQVAAAGRSNGDWRLACNHFAAAGDLEGVHAVLAEAVQQIMGNGQYAWANTFLERFPSLESHPTFDIIRSRMAYQRGSIEEALQLGTRALDAAPDSADALMNLMSLHFQAYEGEKALSFAQRLASSAVDPLQRAIGKAMAAISDSSAEGDLLGPTRSFLELAHAMEEAGHRHFEGIALVNAAELSRVMGDAPDVTTFTTRAIELLEAGAADSEVATALSLRAWAWAHLNDWQRAGTDLAAIDGVSSPVGRTEFQIGAALTHVWYGDIAEADRLLADSEMFARELHDLGPYWRCVVAAAALRRSDIETAARVLSNGEERGRSTVPGVKLFTTTLTAWLGVASGSSAAGEIVERGLDLARRQGSGFYDAMLAILRAAIGSAADWECEIAQKIHAAPASLTILASLVAARLDLLSDQTFAKLVDLAADRAVAWRDPLRRVLDHSGGESAARAGLILDLIGTSDDIPRLRRFSKGSRGTPELGRNLARRLAPRVLIQDLGRVTLRVGEERVAGTAIRRKVAACLVFLGSRPGSSATRDQVLDALWPDLSPEVAVNSLNQTVYFLRRVIEPSYKEELSPGYVHHDSDVLWLDPELVESTSARCWSLIHRMSSPPSPSDVERLCELYAGRFALDFAYEEWAVAYRDSLHAAFLQVIESAVALDTFSGHFDRGREIARRALEIDPEAEQVELSLLRLYRRTGAHAAAAEQYAHYAAVMRNDLGVEPPPLESL
jgi:ATP/maltotriose-dependent transcriptional regulator MalT/DNA-binding SARP family transcriptional activator